MSSCPDEVRLAVVQLLRIGLLRVRSAAASQDSSLCFIEADHLHNLPTLLERFCDDLLRFYLNVEREAYLKQLERHPARDAFHRDVRAMQVHWSVLEQYAHAQAAHRG